MAQSGEFRAVFEEFSDTSGTYWRSKAMPVSVNAYLSAWCNVASARQLSFFYRMQSVGAPSLAISVDFSPWGKLSDNYAQTPQYNPDSNYVTVALDGTYTTKWDGSSTSGGWTQKDPPAGIAAPFVSMRMRVVVSTADVTKFDAGFVRAVR